MKISYRALSQWPDNLKKVNLTKSNPFNTDTKGTEPGVRFTEVSVL